MIQYIYSIVISSVKNRFKASATIVVIEDIWLFAMLQVYTNRNKSYT